jgi:formylglycine-generating enzyme required for sulfatase activity
MPSFLGELRGYYRFNRLAFRRLVDEQYRLSALTGDTSYNSAARLLITELTVSGADLPDRWSDKNSTISGDPVLAESFTDPLVGKFVLVRGGTYMMGCTSFKDQCFPNEKPEHPVVLDHYYMAETEVTQKQWRAVMGTDLVNPGFRCDDCPVERVSWDDAIRFIQKLNTLSAVRYRLPTEAEWEYAARGGHLSRKNYNYAGGLDPGQVAWSEKISANPPTRSASDFPTSWGYMICLAVSEWCQDIYREYAATRRLPLEGWPMPTIGCTEAARLERRYLELSCFQSQQSPARHTLPEYPRFQTGG